MCERCPPPTAHRPPPAARLTPLPPPTTGSHHPQPVPTPRGNPQVNHFPGSWGVGRKDRLCRNLARMKREFGEHYDISAVTYILPIDRAKLQRDMDEEPLVGG
jgi:hypothetical protein